MTRDTPAEVGRVAYAASARSWRTASVRPARSGSPSRESERRKAVKRRSASPRSARKASTASCGGAARGLGEHAAGELAAHLGGVLAHGLQRPALHPRRGRDALELGLDPVQAQLGADREEDLGDLLDRAAGGARDPDHVGRVALLGAQRRGRAPAAPGTPGPTSRSAVCSRRRRRSSEPRSPSTAASRSKPSRPAAIVSSMSPSGSQVRYQRVVSSTSESTPPISSSCGALVDALEPLDDLPARVGAGHLAGDPERAHDVGRLGAALGHQLRHERRPERVDDLRWS